MSLNIIRNNKNKLLGGVAIVLSLFSVGMAAYVHILGKGDEYMLGIIIFYALLYITALCIGLAIRSVILKLKRDLKQDLKQDLMRDLQQEAS